MYNVLWLRVIDMSRERVVILKKALAEKKKQLTAEQANVPDKELKLYICPITLDLIEHPVMLPDGITYEKESVQQHFDTCRKQGRFITYPAIT